MNGSLVLMARVGFFIPNRKHDRSHHGAALLNLRGAGSGSADDMMKVTGHGAFEA
jgi:hypothetical protein